MTNSAFFQRNVSIREFSIPASVPTEKTLIILRGVPGTGKSTKIRDLLRGSYPQGQRITQKIMRDHVVSLDHYFTHYKYPDGSEYSYLDAPDQLLISQTANQQYRHDSSKFGEYAIRSQERVSDMMSRDVTPIIIDNTNTSDWELLPFMGLARMHGYNIVVQEVDARSIWKQGKESQGFLQYKKLLKERQDRTKKTVPDFVLDSMISRMDSVLQQSDKNPSPQSYMSRVLRTTPPGFARFTQQATKGIRRLRQQHASS